MKFNGIDFNKEFWKGKSEAQFLEHEKHHGLSLNQLKEAYAKMNPVPPSEKVKSKVMDKVK